MYISRDFSPLAVSLNASISPGNFVLCLPQSTLATVVLASISNLFCPPALPLCHGWRTPRTTRIRGALTLSENPTWSSEVPANIIAHRNHCSESLQQREVHGAEAQVILPVTIRSFPCPSPSSHQTDDPGPQQLNKKTCAWRVTSSVGSIDSRLHCHVCNFVVLGNSGIFNVQLHI